MLRQRLIVALIIIPPGLFIIYMGGVLFFITMVIFFSIGAYEYTQMMRQAEGDRRPSQPIIVWGALTLGTARTLPYFFSALQPYDTALNNLTLAIIILGATLWHVVDHERGAAHAATDWALTMTGIFYIGWMCSFYVLIRNLPDGMWWFFLTLPPIWLADAGAYTVGRWIGKHPLAPRLSPKKTVEGFIGGVIWATCFGALFGWLGSIGVGSAASAVSYVSGAVIGFIGGLVGMLGDLTISMIKREAGVKDSGTVFGAHGGMLDRIDSWILAGPLVYYVIILFFLR